MAFWCTARSAWDSMYQDIGLLFACIACGWDLDVSDLEMKAGLDGRKEVHICWGVSRDDDGLDTLVYIYCHTIWVWLMWKYE